MSTGGFDRLCRKRQQLKAVSALSGGGFRAFPPVRFGEALRRTQEKLNQKNIYAINPGFDR